MSRVANRARRAKLVPTRALQFSNCDRINLIAGPGHKNFAIIESYLNISLEAPGGGCIEVGVDDEPAWQEAQRILKTLYKHAEVGQPIEPSFVRSVCSTQLDKINPATAAAIRVPRGAVFSARTPAQSEYIKALKNDQKFDMVFAFGPAGTGKTLLAVGFGASQLISGAVERLVITRPALEAGERLGFLPGDLEEKIDPYLLPIWDALRDALGQAAFERLRDNQRIEVAPLAFMRGRTLRNAFIVVDEAQNATIAQMQMVLTRLGAGSRMVVSGDPSQMDLHAGEPSGFPHAMRILKDLQRICICEFSRRDIVRHDLVAQIVAAYEDQKG